MSRPGQEGGPGDHGADLALTGPPAPSRQTRPSPLPPVTTNSLLARAFGSRPPSIPGSVSGIPGVEQCWSPAPSKQGEGSLGMHALCRDLRGRFRAAFSE